jgi:sugar phosphate isomerase/epimerase
MTPPLSINHYICGNGVSFPDFAAAVRGAGIKAVGITRAAISEMGIDGLESCLADHDLTVSSLNSAGYFTQGDPNPIRFTNEELIEAAARLKAEVLCVITGGLGTPPLSTTEAHKRVVDGFANLAERAKDSGVLLGLEPIFPGDILTKGCINSLAHGLEIVAPYDNAKLMVDLYHTWWDPDLRTVLQDRPDKVALVQLCNLNSSEGLIVGRDTLLEGDLDLADLLPSLLSDKYQGKLELELFDRDLNGRDPLSIIAQFPNDLRSCLGQ